MNIILDMNAFKSNLFIISAPSGTGKTVVFNELKRKLPFSIKRITTRTTRSPRISERNGIDYNFTTGATFENLIKGNAFLEYAKVYGNYYGSPIQPILNSINEKRDALLIVDVQGAVAIQQRVAGAVFIFLVPPSLKVLEERLRGRGEDSEDQIKQRLENVKKELSYYSVYNYIVESNNLDITVSTVESIIKTEKCRVNKTDVIAKLI